MNPKLVPVEPKSANEKEQANVAPSDVDSHFFYAAEGKDIACRHFYDKTGQLENDRVQRAPVILDRSKTSKIR